LKWPWHGGKSELINLLCRLIEEDKQRQIAEMKGSLLGFMTGGAKPKEGEEKK
jgi:hypothetical protein